jgi:septal ring factor EnvC (AmiA/AmiB activator)
MAASCHILPRPGRRHCVRALPRFATLPGALPTVRHFPIQERNQTVTTFALACLLSIFKHQGSLPGDPLARTADLQALTADLQALTADLQALTAGLQALTADLQALTAGLQALTADLQALKASSYCSDLLRTCAIAGRYLRLVLRVTQ